MSRMISLPTRASSRGEKLLCEMSPKSGSSLAMADWLERQSMSMIDVHFMAHMITVFILEFLNYA